MENQSESKKYSIMIIYERDINVDFLMDMLSDDYDVRLALNGKKAIEDITVYAPDLILLNINKPEKNGREVCRRLKANDATRELPILFVAEKGEEADEAMGLVMGAEDYISKPISTPITKARINTHIQLKAAREELYRQNDLEKENTRLKALVEQLSGVELKTELNDLIAVPKLLAKDNNLTDMQKEILQRAEECSYRVMQSINSSIDLYKIETKSYYFEPVLVDLVKLLHRLRGDIQSILMARNIGFEITVSGTPVVMTDTFEVLGDETLFYSMFANLIKNAVEASPAGENVVISLDKKDKENLILIHNQGTVPTEIQNRFFDKNITFGKEKAEGLGTYISKLIVLTMEGKISFTSDDEKGTILTIRFPVEYRSNGAAGDGNDRKDKFRIVVIDDYAMMRKLIAGFLRDMGYSNITMLDSGQAAVKYLESEKVNLIISDYDMPGMNGIELLKRVKGDSDLCKVPFVMVTGRSDQNIVANAVSLGVAQYIVKPFTANVLEQKLKGILERRLISD